MSVPASTVSVFAGPVIRTWRIGPRRLAVTLSHNTILGTRSLAVDGEEVAGTAGTTSVFSSRTELSFVADAWAGRVVVERAGGEMRYECLVRAPGEAAEMAVAEENSPGGGGSAGSAADLAAKLRVNVAAPEGGVSEGGEPVVYYEVSCMREADGRGTKVHRRFRDFFALNDAVRSAYQGSQLLGSLPEPPPRGFKFLENHADANFVEKRRWLLADFLYKLESVPRMRQNADFLAFVGLVGNTRETSCFFPAKALGLSLTATDGGRLTEVSGIKPLADGSRSPAQLRGLINVGDKVSKINGEDMFEGGHHDVTLAKLQSAPRPMLVHFLGPATAILPCEITPGTSSGLVTSAPSAAGGGSASAPAAPAPPPPQQPATTTVHLEAARPGAPPPLAEEKGLFTDII